MSEARRKTEATVHSGRKSKYTQMALSSPSAEEGKWQ